MKARTNHLKRAFQLKAWMPLIMFLLLAILVFCKKNDSPCSTNLPNPILSYVVDTTYYGIFYNLVVSNISSFPDDLFKAAPDLPPCGYNTHASRTWVYLIDSNDNSINGWCGIESASELNTVFFIPEGDSLLKGVYIKLEDRRCGIEYKSNILTIN
jgi:hypothetical protein